MKNKKDKGRCGTSRVCLFVFRLLKDNPAIRNRLSVYERDLSRRGFALLRREIDCLRRGFLSFCGRVSRFRARPTRKNSLFPPSFAHFISLIRKMRTAHFRGDAWQKCDFAALYYISFCQIGISVEQKNANISQCVVAKIWLKHNYISESY